MSGGPWEVPKMWAGETVAILASGPSMSREIADRIRARGIRSIAINTTFQIAPWADMLFAADGEWWIHYRKQINGFAGLKVTIAPGPYPGLLTLKNSGRLGFDPKPCSIRTGANSGYQAVHIAAQAGAKRIELHGFDMRAAGNGGVQHWHGQHPGGLRNHGRDIYARWIENFKSIVEPLRDRGVDVVNCTAGSALRWFPFEVEERESIDGAGRA